MNKAKWNKKNTFETNKSGNNIPKLIGCSKNSSKREMYSDKSLIQEKSQTTNFIPQGTRKIRKKIKPKVNRRNYLNNKDQSKIKWNR